ncbi:ATP synthase subunit I [Ilumatobacter sp.]|uniref:ATP synthase subunit I n=1 Tax=Ilumatobacter sp. TaxID=1967498 RepID=UPI003AF898AB
MSSDASPMVTQLDGEPVELQLTFDMVKRGLVVAPVVVAVCALIWGENGAWSAAYAIGLVLVNFLLSAMLISYTAKISLGLMMGATLFGYLIRLGLIMAAVLLVKDTDWISLPALGATIIVTHLGLLVWELKYVAISLAHSGVKPARP